MQIRPFMAKRNILWSYMLFLKLSLSKRISNGVFLLIDSKEYWIFNSSYDSLPLSKNFSWDTTFSQLFFLSHLEIELDHNILWGYVTGI